MSPQWHGKRCKECGGTPEQVGPISGTGLCEEHAHERRAANMQQLHEHNGPYFDHWRRRTLAAFGVTLPDDSQSAA